MSFLPNPNSKGPLGAAFSQALSKTNSALADLNILRRIDESGARLRSAGLNATGFSSGSNLTFNENQDWRVRVGLGLSSKIFYLSQNPGIMSPLITTGGVVFPYTPQVSISYVNNYSAVSPTHSINSTQAYQNSDVSSITISGMFTAQSQAEADYVLAAIHFFRSASKMFFGNSDTGNQGNPPPLMFLNGYGASYFNNVPVIMTSFGHTMTDDVDFVTASDGTRIGASSSLAITLMPQYSRNKMSQFNLDQFASGDLLNRGFI